MLAQIYMRSKAQFSIKRAKLRIRQVLNFVFKKKELISLILISSCSVISWIWGLEHWIFNLDRFLPFEGLVFFLFLLFYLAALVSILNYLTLQEDSSFADLIIALCIGGLAIYFSLLSWQSDSFQFLFVLSQNSDLIGLISTLLLYGIFFMAILGDLWISFQIMPLLHSAIPDNIPSHIISLGKGILTLISLLFLTLGIFFWFWQGDAQALGLNRSTYEIGLLCLLIFGIIILLGVLDWILSPIRSMDRNYNPEMYLQILKKNFQPCTIQWLRTVWFIVGLFFIYISLANNLIQKFYSLLPTLPFEIVLITRYLIITFVILAIIGLPVALESLKAIFRINSTKPSDKAYSQ
ncbi:MAG: hypothetical protein ACFFCZ_13690 [Promethearchaeota archaeon]